MTKPLVSIIIPVFNSQAYLAETIRSALAQTWPNKEIIIVDDGSADQSLNVARGFTGPCIRIFEQENKGAGAARNKGLAAAKGEYIQYLDADDLISPNKIQDQINLLQNKPGYIISCPTVYFFDGEDHQKKNAEDLWVKEGSDNPVDFLIKLYGGDIIGQDLGGMIAVHSWLCPRGIIDKAGRWNEALSVDDDGEYFSRVILASAGVLYAAKCFNYYRKHTTHKSLSALNSAKAFQSMLDAADSKYTLIYAASHDKQLINKIFGRIYTGIGVDSYPQFKEISACAIRKAKSLGYFKPRYKTGKMTKFWVRVFGWRLIKTVNHYRYNYKRLL